MNIIKEKINGYDVFMYKTKKYTTINMKFLFQIPYTKENIYTCDILAEYMLHTSKKYKTRKDLSEKRMELYSMGFGINNYNIGEQLFIDVSYSFFDPVLVKDTYLKDALKFASTMLFEPNFEDGHLDEKELTRIKKNLITGIKDSLVNPRKKANRKIKRLSFDDTYIVRDYFTDEEEVEEFFNNIKEEDIIKMYSKIIGESLVGLIIMGNIKDEYLEYIKEFFKFKKTRLLNKDYKEALTVNDKTPLYNKEIDKNASESIVKCIYSCPKKNFKEECTYMMLIRMIGSVGALMHKVLREELKLVYMVGHKYNRKANYMLLTAYVDAVNYQKALDGFDLVFKRLEDEEECTKLLNLVKEEIELDNYTFDENKSYPFHELDNLAFGFDVSHRKKSKVMCSVTVEDIRKILKKIEKKKILFYEGAKKR